MSSDTCVRNCYLGAKRFKYDIKNGKSHLTAGCVPTLPLVVITSEISKEGSGFKVLTQKMDVGATPLEVANRIFVY